MQAYICLEDTLISEKSTLHGAYSTSSSSQITHMCRIKCIPHCTQSRYKYTQRSIVYDYLQASYSAIICWDSSTVSSMNFKACIMYAPCLDALTILAELCLLVQVLAHLCGGYLTRSDDQVRLSWLLIKSRTLTVLILASFIFPSRLFFG